MRKIVAVAAGLAAAVGITAGTVAAQPDSSEAVEFTANATDTQTVIKTVGGSMVVEDGVFKIKATDGTVLAGTELKFRLDEFEFPIAANIADHTATLTPQLDMSKATYKPVALPFEDKAPWKTDYDREQAAWSRLTSTISMGATIGTLVGGLGGAAVGCVLGGTLGGAVVGGTVVGLFGPFVGGVIAGCLGGAAAVGALGVIAGQIFVTAPVAIAAAIQYFSTINQPSIPPAK